MSLKQLKQALIAKQSAFQIDYHIPEIWLLPEKSNSSAIIKINPIDFFLNRIEEIEKLSNTKKKKEFKNKNNWTNSANIYNFFVRLFTAFDHNQNGQIDLISEFRETGTFLKAIALLPYLYSLGIDALYLLPIASLGADRKKGSLGSPYSIKNPYKIEESLSEPFLGLGAEKEFAAFVEAAKMLDMKITLEFVFRTASVDSDLAIEHPNWFYWIDENLKNRERGSNNPNRYGPPIFSDNMLEIIKDKINNQDLKGLPAPLKAYQNLFKEVVGKPQIIDGRVIGKDKNGKKLKIASAFADWPPDDNQPVWSDVTYLKLYDSQKFNYVAYNTVRMYDTKLSDEKYINRELCDFIINIPQHFIKEFDIDGIMIDMGHVLPNDLRADILKKAREIKPDFTFWEENFSINQASKDNAYDAVLGYMPFDAHDINKVKGLLWRLSTEKLPIHFFSTSETHNVRRTASINASTKFSKLVYLLSAFIPEIQFIHEGFELCETKPINTGLCFTDEEILAYPPDKLALFSESALSWTNDDNIIEFIRQVKEIRNTELTPELSDNFAIEFVETYNQNLAAFRRKSIRGEFDLLIVLNYSENPETFYYEQNGLMSVEELLNKEEIKIDWSKFNSHLAGWEGKIFKLSVKSEPQI